MWLGVNQVFNNCFEETLQDYPIEKWYEYIIET